METRRLGPLSVSVVGLGCNNFGRRIDAVATKPVVDAALDAGITFLDTADVYGEGESERLIARALGDRRDAVVLATKFGKPMGDGVERRGTRAYMRAALEASLQRLATDRVDLYLHHEEDTGTPLEETVGALDELVREGKIRAYGTSNYTAARIERFASLARGPYVSEQSEYSWLTRHAEDELLPTCERLGLGFIPYFPLASGLLTGKYRRGQPAPEGTRLEGREISSRQYDRVEALEGFARERGVTLLDVAIGGLAAMRPVASVIAGATKPEQARANAAAGGWTPSEEELAALRALV